MSTSDALNVFGLAGKSAIVTGAASGIGRATAGLFAEVGARVLLVDLDHEAAKAAAAELKAEGAGCDIAETDQVTALFEHVRSAWGGLDILVNCAAYRRKADTMTMPVSEWDVMHAVTRAGRFYACARRSRSCANKPRAARS